MNDRRFIELLNLYLDHQIDPVEARELEAEVLRDPARRKTYDQYCKLQRGCSLLGERERACSPAAQRFLRSLEQAEQKIAFPRATPFWRPAQVSAFAGLAMAACVTVVVVSNRPDKSLSPSGEVASATANKTNSSESLAPSSSRFVPVVVASFDQQPKLAPADLRVARSLHEAEIAATDREALEWMQRVDQLPVRGLVVDEHAFEGRATIQTNTRVFHSHQGMPSNAEFTNYQFQR